MAVLLLDVPAESLDELREALDSVADLSVEAGPDPAVLLAVRASSSRYARLAEWLLHARASGAEVVTLLFDEVERIIGGDLPPSAVSRRGWWASSQVQAEWWVLCGWEALAVPKLKRVHFTRIE